MTEEAVMVLKSVGVLSAAKIVGLMYAILGLIMGLIFATRPTRTFRAGLRQCSARARFS